MLNPRQQAKLAVLKHVSSTMKNMMAGKLKKPPVHAEAVDIHMEKLPGELPGGLPEGSPQEESMESPLQEKQEEPGQLGSHSLHEKGLENPPQHQGGNEEEDPELLAKLHEMYSKL